MIEFNSRYGYVYTRAYVHELVMQAMHLNHCLRRNLLAVFDQHVYAHNVVDTCELDVVLAARARAMQSNLRRLAKLVPPRVHVVVFLTVFNGWYTDRWCAQIRESPASSVVGMSTGGTPWSIMCAASGCTTLLALFCACRPPSSRGR